MPELAYATDPTSAFGGIIAFNTPLDAATAKVILDRQFVEVLIAPDYEPAALEYAQKKPTYACCASHGDGLNNFDSKRVGSGLLLQSSDNRGMTRDELKVVSKLAPTDKQFTDLLFAWKVAKFVKSNAIVYAKDNRTIGVGAGQMSRVYSARIAGIKAADANRGRGFGDGLRCVLPVPRRHRCRRCRRHQGGYPAGRFDARCRSDRRRRRTWPGHGVHRRAPLPPLIRITKPGPARLFFRTREPCPMKILVIGSGGREHALAWKLAQSSRVTDVIVAPGNAGTTSEDKCRNVAVKVTDIDGLALAQAEGVALTVVGPEVPLVAGVVDRFRAAGLRIFGPTAAAAQLEGSKAYARTSWPATTSPPRSMPCTPTWTLPWPTSARRVHRSWSRPMAWPPARA